MFFSLSFAIYGRGGGVSKGLFVQQTFGNNWGACFPPGALPVKSYWRLTAKKLCLDQEGFPGLGVDGSCKVELNFRSE
jgi:hypothetical protein